jgi:hypothetical protein
MEQESSLSFFELNRRLDAMPEFEASAPGADRKVLYGFALALVAYCASFLVTRLVADPRAQLALLAIVLSVEVIGLCMTIWYSRRDYLSLRKPVLNFSRQLDHDFPYHFELLDWLKGQPFDLLERHASMAKFRRERFTQKLPLIAGSIPTLGLLPVVIAVYFQIREYAAGRHLSWVDFVAGFIVAILYVTAWGAALMKARVEAMDMYLQIALDMKRAEPADNPRGAAGVRPTARPSFQ